MQLSKLALKNNFWATSVFLLFFIVGNYLIYKPEAIIVPILSVVAFLFYDRVVVINTEAYRNIIILVVGLSTLLHLQGYREESLYLALWVFILLLFFVLKNFLRKDLGD